MDEHFHTGIVALTVTAVGVMVVFQLIRLGAAQLATHDGTAALGKSLGALFTFS